MKVNKKPSQPYSIVNRLWGNMCVWGKGVRSEGNMELNDRKRDTTLNKMDFYDHNNNKKKHI